MVEKVLVPNKALINTFRDVLEEEYERAKKQITDIDPELQTSFIRRLASICNSISESLIKSTAQMHLPYTGKAPPIQSAPVFSKENKESIDLSQQLESRNCQIQLSRAISTACLQVHQEVDQLLAQLKAAAQVELPNERPMKIPDLAGELTAYNRSVKYERDLKDRAVQTLKLAEREEREEEDRETEMERRVHSQLLWMP